MGYLNGILKIFDRTSDRKLDQALSEKEENLPKSTPEGFLEKLERVYKTPSRLSESPSTQGADTNFSQCFHCSHCFHCNWTTCNCFPADGGRHRRISRQRLLRWEHPQAIVEIFPRLLLVINCRILFIYIYII